MANRSVLFVFSLLCLVGCGRTLTDAEQAFVTATLPGLDTSAVRLHQGPSLTLFPLSRPPRPPENCQDRIVPRETATRVRYVVGGFVWRNRVVMAGSSWSPDYLPDWPEKLPLGDAMFLAHELTHVWQWQSRATTDYAPIKAVAEQVTNDDPYRFSLEPERGFLDYGYEQQASLVEEFVCCRALDPEGAKTDALHALLAPHFPGLVREDSVGDVALPWSGAETEGICSVPWIAPT
ncbi:MAG: hypothetical protein AAFY90_06970 [Pseudomonadota bacterium]